VRLDAGMARSVLLDHAAEILGVCRRTVYYRIREGRLVTIRRGGSQRVLVESIEALLREEREERRVRGRDAGASDRGLSGKFRAP